jgi:hypothetical protein
MKMKMSAVAMVLLLSPWAVSAFAQSGTQNQTQPSEPVQEQTTPRDFTGEGNATGNASQTHTESGPEAALGGSGAGAGTMDSRGTGSGTLGTTGSGSVLLGDGLLKSNDIETGTQNRSHSFDEDMGYGGTARHDEYAEEGGPHGLLSGEGSDQTKGMFGAFIDEDMDGFADFPNKVLGEDGPGSMSGVIRVQGPGIAGPHTGAAGFGTANEETRDLGVGRSTRVRGAGRK